MDHFLYFHALSFELNFFSTGVSLKVANQSCPISYLVCVFLDFLDDCHINVLEKKHFLKLLNQYFKNVCSNDLMNEMKLKLSGLARYKITTQTRRHKNYVVSTQTVFFSWSP